MKHSLTKLSLIALLIVPSGCSIKHMAVDMVGDALAGSGTTFASDNDPELIRDAVPFSLKLMESLLAETPNHEGLLTATASGFTQYAYAFVQQDADMLHDTDLQRSRKLQARAKKLFLRGRDYGLRGLEVSHKGFRDKLENDPMTAVADMKKSDVPLLYWTAAAWVAAIASDKTDSYLISDLPKVDALVQRALALDEPYDHGALESLMITYETVRQGAEGDPYERAKKRFERAVDLSKEAQAGPYVSYAEAVDIPTEKRAEFLHMLETALAIDPDVHPEFRLANLIMQERARWLKSRVDDYFLPPLNEN
ncbi:hypothetical protein GC207_13765 [bacterium]|nr:hypothetical protein [bacterium]